MSDKFKQERAANVTKPGEKSLDPDLLQSRQDYPATPKGDLVTEQSQSSAGDTSVAQDQRPSQVASGAHASERQRNVLKPGEKPIETENIPAKTDGARGQRAANLTKPGEQPLDSDDIASSSEHGGQGETKGTESYKPVEWDDSKKPSKL